MNEKINIMDATKKINLANSNIKNINLANAKINLEELKEMRRLNKKNLNIIKKQHLMKPIYAVKDDAVGFLDVLCHKNDAMAFRYFESACMNEETSIHKYAEQFSLYKVGEIDEQTGEIKAELRLIAKAKDIVENGKDKDNS